MGEKWHWHRADPLDPLDVASTMDSIELFRSINAASAAVPAPIWMTLSLLGTGWAAFALVTPFSILAPRIFYAVVIAAPLAGFCSRVMKALADAPRPPAVLEPGSFVLLGQALKANSMPSGHTITAFTVVAAIHFSAAKPSWVRGLLLFALATAAGIARISIGVHWVEDVVVGAAIGTLAGYAGAKLASRIPASALDIRSWWLRSLSLWGVLCVGVLVLKELDFAANKPAQLILAAVASLSLAVFWQKSFKRPA